MAGIANDVKQIRQALYGREVREAIAHGIEQCYSDVTASKTVADTAAAAANTATQNAQTATQQANQARDNAQAVADGVVNQSITAINDAATQQRQSINDLGDQLKSYMSEHYSETITKAEAKANRSSVSTVKHATGTDGQLTLTDALNEPAKKMTIHLEPKQDLHGYDKPWVGGAGKNLLDPNIFVDGTRSSMTVSHSDGGLIHFSGAPTAQNIWANPNGYGLTLPAGTYTLRAYPNSARLCSGANTNPSIINTSTNGLGYGTFTLTEQTEISVSVTFTQYTEYDIDEWLMLVEGSGVPEFEPYENICPITGYDTVEVVGTGKNMLRGWTQISSTSKTELIHVDFVNDNFYTVNIGSDFRDCKGIIYYFNKNKEYVGRSVGLSSWPFTARPMTSISMDASGTLRENNIKYIQIVIYSGIPSPVTISVLDGLNVQVKCNDTSTDYVESIHNEISINLVSSAGSTVYGGTITVNEDGSGTLVVNKVYHKFSDFTWSYLDTYKSFRAGNTTANNFDGVYKSGGQEDGEAFCDSYKIIRLNSSDTQKLIDSVFSISIGSGISTYRLFVNDPRFNGDVNAFISEMGKATLCYLLAEPQTYPLTATQLQTLAGTNHVWTDGTNIELDYYGDKYCTYEQVMEMIANALRS